jgi:predicted ATPase/class 3 adenylate cyclase/tetratricopeptide (TPR) repeat protein
MGLSEEAEASGRVVSSEPRHLTFLFTDVGGSTRLWEHAPNEMREAMARHDALIEGAVGEHGGVVVRPRGEGDSRFAVFLVPESAVAAAVAMQRALDQEVWNTPEPIRVRVALHTGEATLRDGDYYGAAVNRCARLRGVAHPGQILVSGATTDLVRSKLSASMTLLGLGKHRLKDLEEPEQVFQLCHPELQREFPPIKSLNRLATNLPAQTTRLIGRAREVETIVDCLCRPDVRLLTLTGPGGTGKTRLAVEACAEVLDRFEDGVFFVDLAPILAADLVLHAVARVLGLQHVGHGPVASTLEVALGRKQLLIVLDNFEQVVEAAPVVTELLAECPHLKFLVTSRTALRVPGEHEIAVPTLPVPDTNATVDAAAIARCDAVRLFVERAQAVRPEFALTDTNAAALAELVRRVDGLPLAVELAAAQVRLLPLNVLLEQLQHHIDVLGGARTSSPRQRSLRAAIEWSYGLLDASERTVFETLAVFDGGFTLEAAEAVCGPRLNGEPVLPILGSLVDKSLVRAEADLDEVRFTQLQTISQFGLSRLRASGDLAEVQHTHAVYFVHMAEEAAPDLFRTPSAHWADRLDREQANFRGVRSWCIEHGSQVETQTLGLRLVVALSYYWFTRDDPTEVGAWVDQVLDSAHSAPPVLRAFALGHAANLARIWSNYQRVELLGNECLQLSEQEHFGAGVAWSFAMLGTAAFVRQDYERATELLEQALVGARQEGAFYTGAVAALLGQVVQAQGDFGRAEAVYGESLRNCQSASDRLLEAWPLNRLGTLAWLRGDYALAELRHSQAVECYTDLSPRLAAETLLYLAIVARDSGDLDRARLQVERASEAFRRVGSAAGLATAKVELAHLACQAGNLALAEQLLEEGMHGIPAGDLELEASTWTGDLEWGVACCKRARGDFEAARRWLQRGLRRVEAEPNKWQAASLMEELAEALNDEGLPQEAVRLYAASESVRSRVGPKRPGAQAARVDEVLVGLREAVGDAGYELEWAQGRSMTTRDAIRFACELASTGADRLASTGERLS